MKYSKLTVFMAPLFAVSLLAGACGEKKEDKGGAAAAGDTPAKAAGGDKKGDPSAWADIELPKLGIIANAPGDAKVSQMGGISAMNYKCQAMISEKSDMSPSYDNELKNAQGPSAGGLKELIKNEKTDEDNFAIEWTTNSGKFGFKSRKTVGDKVFSCSRVSSDEEGHKCVMKVCASLKAK